MTAVRSHTLEAAALVFAVLAVALYAFASEPALRLMGTTAAVGLGGFLAVAALLVGAGERRFALVGAVALAVAAGVAAHALIAWGSSLA
jgi:hypothetical protein